MSEGDLKTAKTQLKWIGTPSLGQGRSSGGNAASEIFEAGGSQRKRSLLETLVREICQNSLDQSCLLYTSPSPRDKRQSRMPSSA